MLTILRRNFGERLFESRKFSNRRDVTGTDLCRIKLLYRNLECIAGEEISPGGDLYEMHPYLRFFSFFREPISRCASNFQWYLNCKAKYHYPGVPAGLVRHKWRLPKDIKGCVRQWLEKHQRNLLTQRIAGCQNADRAIEILHERVGFVGLVERFDESLVMWREWTGQVGLKIAYRPMNVSAAGRYPRPQVLKQLMADDPAIARQVAEFNELDQRIYDHVRTEIFAAQLARYDCALCSFDRDSLVLRRGLDAGAVNVARRWMFRSLLYKPLRPILFRRSA